MLRKIFPKTADRELGFGTAVGTLPGERLMLADGSFNVVRKSEYWTDNIYFDLVMMSWKKFLLIVFFSYLILNSIFAWAYCSVGIEHLSGVEPGSFSKNFLAAFFFSTQTMTTVGYGNMSPVGLPANLIASFESLTGLLSFALISGLLYGRFSRPKAKILFSQNMLISPFKVAGAESNDGKAMMFRMVNTRRSELIETEAAITMAFNQTNEDGTVIRRYLPLPLQLNKIAFFTLGWTVVHPIDEKSPLFGLEKTDLEALRPEFIVLIKGVEEAYEQTVHVSRSYVCEDMIWGAKFKPFLSRDRRGRPLVVSKMIGDFEVV